jgi:hypothetical protein
MLMLFVLELQLEGALAALLTDRLFSLVNALHVQRIPVWWRWYYWANPVSWTLYGLLTSQFGDLDQPLLMADGVTSTTVVAFLEEHFGFRHDFLGAVAAMVAGFCVLFAVVFALAIKYLNFQRR